MAIFNAEKKFIASDCTVTTEKWLGPEMKYIGDNKWAYTTSTDQQIQFTCSTEKERNKIMTLSATGVIELQDGCSASTDHWILPASLHHQSQQQQNPTVTSRPFSFQDIPMEISNKPTASTTRSSVTPDKDNDLLTLINNNNISIQKN